MLLRELWSVRRRKEKNRKNWAFAKGNRWMETERERLGTHGEIGIEIEKAIEKRKRKR